MTVRKRVSSQAAAADLSVYADGVRMMKERSARERMDPLGWYYQSRMHGNPEATERRPDEPEDWSQANTVRGSFCLGIACIYSSSRASCGY